MKIAQIDSPFKGIQVPSSGGNINVNNTNVGEIISKSLTYIFGAAALLLLIYLVTAGLSIMTSRGDPKAMQLAQAKITNAVIGFVVIFFSTIIISIIGKIFGIAVFGNIFGS